MKLLLGSGGFGTPERQAAWAKALDQFLGPVRQVLFVPFAGFDYDLYLSGMRKLDFHSGRELIGIHQQKDPKRAIDQAEAIYIGGGNTFRLLNELYRQDLLEVIRKRVRANELRYIGVSAGTNMACPSMKTTNDMPIVAPPSLEALGLIPFQINPHYFSGAIHYQTEQGLIPYGGETRDDRIREFHLMNETPVLGIAEGGILRVEEGTYTLCGTAGARLFRKGQPPLDLPVGAEIAAP